MEPTIGRIVHVTPAEGKDPIAAIVTAVWANQHINATGFLPSGHNQAFFTIPHAIDDKPTAGAWNWPPRQ